MCGFVVGGHMSPPGVGFFLLVAFFTVGGRGIIAINTKSILITTLNLSNLKLRKKYT